MPYSFNLDKHKEPLPAAILVVPGNNCHVTLYVPGEEEEVVAFLRGMGREVSDPRFLTVEYWKSRCNSPCDEVPNVKKIFKSGKTKNFASALDWRKMMCQGPCGSKHERCRTVSALLPSGALTCQCR